MSRVSQNCGNLQNIYDVSEIFFFGIYSFIVISLCVIVVHEYYIVRLIFDCLIFLIKVENI